MDPVERIKWTLMMYWTSQHLGELDREALQAYHELKDTIARYLSAAHQVSPYDLMWFKQELNNPISDHEHYSQFLEIMADKVLSTFPSVIIDDIRRVSDDALVCLTNMSDRFSETRNLQTNSSPL